MYLNPQTERDISVISSLVSDRNGPISSELVCVRVVRARVGLRVRVRPQRHVVCKHVFAGPA